MKSGAGIATELEVSARRCDVRRDEVDALSGPAGTRRRAR